MLRRALGVLVAPIQRLGHRLFPVRDPWKRLSVRAPLYAFGGGARRGFDWVFEGESAVEIRSFDELLDWLDGCSYSTDRHLFQEHDFWQHPRTFEHLRQGDCEDFALWAWRKMIELGFDADLVVGRRVPPEATNSRHAWIIFRRDADELVFEPACRDRNHAIRPLEAVRHAYIPEFGVSPDRQRFAFAGYAYFRQNRHLGRGRSASEAGDERIGELPHRLVNELRPSRVVHRDGSLSG